MILKKFFTVRCLLSDLLSFFQFIYTLPNTLLIKYGTHLSSSTDPSPSNTTYFFCMLVYVLCFFYYFCRRHLPPRVVFYVMETSLRTGEYPSWRWWGLWVSRKSHGIPWSNTCVCLTKFVLWRVPSRSVRSDIWKFVPVYNQSYL